MSHAQQAQALVLDGKYRIDKCIGKGSFGEVYAGYHLVDKHLVAIKVAEKSHSHILYHEYQIYMDLLKAVKPPLVPTIYWYGTASPSSPSSPSQSPSPKTYMVMKYLGRSLEYLIHTYCGGKLTLKSTLMVSIQLFDLLMKLHSCGYVHRDIKPENFLVGIGPERSKIYLIDFGLAKRFKSEERVHIKPCENKKLTGTARYASINSHHRIELSRRDDLESLGYLMIYFLKGRLPWQGIVATSKEEKYQKIGEAKESYRLDQLCEGVPTEIYNFLAHVRSLEFKQKPNYYYLRSLLVNAFNRMDYEFDGHYDWEDQVNQAQCFINYMDDIAGAPV